MSENYIPGYSSNATAFMAERTVDSHAAFFKPYLQAGMHLLDCGCGPGTITLGLAVLVFPGTVIGIDQEQSQINIATENALAQQISNASFQTASVYELPFPDSSFDAVFSHALIEHLQNPINALRELFRVLKPGGVIGVRSPDWGGFLVVPLNPTLEQAFTYYKQLQQENGGDPYVGRQLHILLQKAKFERVNASASYQCYKPLSLIGNYLALRIEASETTDRAIEKGWTDAATLTSMSHALRAWSANPEGWFAQSWCEAVGYKAAKPARRSP